MSRMKLQVNLFDMILSISRVVDLMSPAIGKHHMQVAYLAYRIGEQLELSEENLSELMMAGALHDIGAFSLKDRFDLMEFEDTDPGVHAEAGYLILREINLFSAVAALVRFHHIPWQNGKGAFHHNQSVSLRSHILHLADRMAVAVSNDRPILSQVDGICNQIAAQKGIVFVPEQVEAMLTLAKKDYIWLEVTSEFIESILRRDFLHHNHGLSFNQMLAFARLICHLIDFKSEFTATHSSGVAATALYLSGLAGFSAYERKLVEMAAYLHDLGKLAIPSEILEKRAQLNDDEWFVMRAHVYYTYETLIPFEMLQDIVSWGGLHQERLDGSGYPFGYSEDEIPLGARIMAVADVFTALTENRPYRKQMGKQEALDVMQLMAGQGELDKKLVFMAADHYSNMNTVREMAQQQAVFEYNTFKSGLH